MQLLVIVLNMDSNIIKLNLRYFSFSIYSFYVESVLLVLTSTGIFTDKIRGLFTNAASSLYSFIYNEKPLSIPTVLFFVSQLCL
jgi:hypothetical protein